MGDPTRLSGGLPRRVVAAGLLAAGSALLRRPAGAAEPLPRDLALDIRRKGALIGTHRVAFRPAEAGAGFEALTTVDIAVKVALVTAYRYRQEARDLWRGDRLVDSEVETDDDGKKSRVRVRGRPGAGGRLEVEGPSGVYAAEPGTMTDLCFWNPAAADQRRLIDGQHGDLMPLELAQVARETVAVAGLRVPAVRHGFTSTRGREGRVWYDEAGRWLRAEYVTRGELLTMEPREG